MRITKKVFTDLTVFMVGLGVCVGIFFPFFIMIFNVPKEIVLRPVFFAACIGAGIVLAMMNIFLARKIVGSRIQQLSQKMKHVEEILLNSDHNTDHKNCTADSCQIKVDSEDELGESAASFNNLIKTLSEVLEAQSSLQLFSGMLTSHLELDSLANQALRNLVKITQTNGGAILIENNGEFSLKAFHAIQNEKSLESNALILDALKTHERYIVKLPRDIVLDGEVPPEIGPKTELVKPGFLKQYRRSPVARAGGLLNCYEV